jgi:hypothetical protein
MGQSFCSWVMRNAHFLVQVLLQGLMRTRAFFTSQCKEDFTSKFLCVKKSELHPQKYTEWTFVESLDTKNLALVGILVGILLESSYFHSLSFGVIAAFAICGGLPPEMRISSLSVCEMRISSLSVCASTFVSSVFSPLACWMHAHSNCILWDPTKIAR